MKRALCSNTPSFHIARLIIDTALFAFPANLFIAWPHVSLELKTIPKYIKCVAISIVFSLYKTFSFEFSRGVSNQRYYRRNIKYVQINKFWSSLAFDVSLNFQFHSNSLIQRCLNTTLWTKKRFHSLSKVYFPALLSFLLALLSHVELLKMSPALLFHDYFKQATCSDGVII